MIIVDHLLICTRHISSASTTLRCRNYYYSHFIDEKLKLIYVNQLVQSQTCSILWSEFQVNAFNPCISQLTFTATWPCFSSSLCFHFCITIMGPLWYPVYRVIVRNQWANTCNVLTTVPVHTCSICVGCYYHYCCYLSYIMLPSLAGWRECGGHRCYKQRGYSWVCEHSWGSSAKRTTFLFPGRA